MLSASLYIHIPWCIRKCPYCDFNSHRSPETLPEKAYINALIADFDEDLHYLPRREISSIFIGGGTPSLFSAEGYNELFAALRQRIIFSPSIEITLEANPGTVEQARFQAYRSAGINRLSLGIQSFNPEHLKRLGRIHDDKQAHAAISMARQAGFDNINLDIMHSLPHQTVEEGYADIEHALSYYPEHISWYELTLEPNTVFYKQRPPLPDDEVSEELEKKGLALLAASGFTRYEISAFATPHREAKHNLNYWLFGDYYGIGAGAHSKITLESGEICRVQKRRQPTDYLHPDKSFIATKTHISTEERVFEFMLNTTRLQRPIAHKLFSERTGLPLEMLMPLLKLAENKGLLIIQDETWQVTALGRRYTNDLQALFLQDFT